jgi:hypothetical protein
MIHLTDATTSECSVDSFERLAHREDILTPFHLHEKGASISQPPSIDESMIPGIDPGNR